MAIFSAGDFLTLPNGTRFSFFDDHESSWVSRNATRGVNKKGGYAIVQEAGEGPNPKVSAGISQLLSLRQEGFGRRLTPDGNGLRWETPRGVHRFEVECGQPQPR